MNNTVKPSVGGKKKTRRNVSGRKQLYTQKNFPKKNKNKTKKKRRKRSKKNNAITQKNLYPEQAQPQELVYDQQNNNQYYNQGQVQEKRPMMNNVAPGVGLGFGAGIGEGVADAGKEAVAAMFDGVED